MKHDELIIDSKGRYHLDLSSELRQALQLAFAQINNTPLKPARIIMSEEDYKDILAWQNEK